jgi:hypothetical protein
LTSIYEAKSSTSNILSDETLFYRYLGGETKKTFSIAKATPNIIAKMRKANEVLINQRVG